MTTPVTDSSLRVENLSKSYPTAGEPLQVLSNVSLSLDGGDSLAIVGPSGCGKSTLLQILGTLDHPDQGSVRIDGQDPFALNEKELAGFRNQHVGFVFQDHHLLPQLTVLENVLVPALAQGRPEPERFEHAEQLLESVGLVERRGHLPSELSGGERERVAIARALLMRPSLVLADEPTGNLDRRTADSVTELLLDLPASRGVILVVVTHSHSLAEALKQSCELRDGQLVQC
ncbi:ABC transporter ATP-binding protein [Novipirellula sp. SH528]|uniref:ABC transporter ATP-binding protein n=1 Tax=Novipirellula sp. SH528 TaxID=3454466 RepID=UPI003F9FAF65